MPGQQFYNSCVAASMLQEYRRFLYLARGISLQLMTRIPCSFFVGQILGALKEGNSGPVVHHCGRLIMVAYVSTSSCFSSTPTALNGEANSNVGTLATVLNTTMHSLP